MTDLMMVGTHEHYVISDGVRSYVGPIRHAATRKVLRARGRGRSILDKLKFWRKRDQGMDVVEASMERRPETLADMVNRAFAPMLQAMQPSPPRGWRRLWGAVVDRFYDEDWHRGMRNTAATVLMWGFTVASVVCFGKGMLWILSL